MMKWYKKLSIGDVVKNENGTVVEITGITTLGGLTIEVLKPFSSCSEQYSENKVAISRGAKRIVKLNPIPITEELLKQKGITEEEYFFYDAYHFKFKDGKTSYVDAGEFLFVHELQHALRLCGLHERASSFLTLYK